jgi:signal transduction histidine kinase
MSSAGIGQVTYGPGYTVGTVFVLGLFAAALLALVLKRHKEDSKAQIDLILTGIAIAVTANTLVGFVFINANFATGISFVGPLTILLFELLFALAIVRHGLFNLNATTARAASYVVVLGMSALVYIAVFYTVGLLVFDLSSLNTRQHVFIVCALVLIAVLSPSLRLQFNKLTNRLFFKDLYDTQQLLNEVNSLLVRSDDLRESLTEIADLIKDKMHITSCNLYLDEDATIDFHTAGTDLSLFTQSNWERLEKIARQDDAPKIFLVTAETGLEQEAIDQLRIGIVVKMVVSQRTVGFVVLGLKQSGDEYTASDFQILEIIADEIAIAVQNRIQYEQISQFNITLQDKVDDATKRLKKTNDKLKAMDETKDEFISMASHQLRTPLTSVKGYLSMVLEGDAGQLNDMQQKLLSQAFTSSQRMVFLIADLLNLSRLRTGKFIIEAQPTNLAELIAGEVSQLKETAAGRSLTLNYDKPETFPILMLDETKIRQVVMNFVDNAIYYTPAGGSIEIRLTETPKSVEFTVHDNGIGVPKAEQHHLFNKFYRAKNAQKARPDGTGLGLFMAKKVIVAQGGAIIFTSKEGKGSTFGFSFSKEKLKPKV